MIYILCIKVIVFYRGDISLCEQMITLLCSYAILVYELLHREAAGGGSLHGNPASSLTHAASDSKVSRVLERLEEIVASNYSLKAH